MYVSFSDTSISFISVVNNQCLLKAVFPILSASNNSACSRNSGGGDGFLAGESILLCFYAESKTTF